MLSRHNHSNNKIDTTNYEEYFILYMDNELGPEDRMMVDNFIAAHPDLKAELELLLSTKLNHEEGPVILKHDLMADAMKKNLLTEDLLLYMDNELSTGKVKDLVEKLESDKELDIAYRLLLKTRLDASEEISYPDKKELYRRRELNVLSFTRIKVAAAIILLIFMGLGYGIIHSINKNNVTAVALQNHHPALKNAIKPVPDNYQPRSQPETTPDIRLAGVQNKKNFSHLGIHDHKNQSKGAKYFPVSKDNQMNLVSVPLNKINYKTRPTERNSIATIDLPSKTITDRIVTSLPPNRIIIENATTLETGPENTSTAHNDRKGSLKGFLRKAARVIEKKTGIDPTSNDDELLIGAVAVKLK